MIYILHLRQYENFQWKITQSFSGTLAEVKSFENQLRAVLSNDFSISIGLQ